MTTNDEAADATGAEPAREMTPGAEAEPLERLVDTLRTARLRRRMTMASVTTRSGLGRTTVSQAFSGRSLPSAETLVALAGALGLAADTLLALRSACLRRPDTVPHAPPRLLATGSVRNTELRPPEPEPAAGSADLTFESRYRSYLRERHGHLTVVGLDLRGDAQVWWPLDAAYLSLELADRRAVRVGDGLGSGQQRTERAEVALAGRWRVLVRGLAGSGKTTLVQWLACASASGDLPEPLRELRGTVAFVLPMRTISRRGELPRPADFLAAVGCPLAEAQPDGWADRVLSSGRGLVLVDGLDEVPRAFRDRAGDWLRELTAAYGTARVVATTRPTAVPERWLQEVSFSELAVRPMTGADVSVFISRWHTAAREGAPSTEARARLDVLERELREKVRAKRDLALLTTTPLLCALVCALHRDRGGQLPHDRVEIYEAALSMLLYRRDQEREVHRPEGIALSEKESIQLLQKLAYWLTLNGQTELVATTATWLIDDALSSMAPVAEQGDAAAVLDHLVGRTGLLRAPTTDTIDFVHRTFQDFLGAKAAVEGYHLPLIVKNAHDEQWEDVVRMAVAHARPDERATLLRGIIERADRQQQHRTRLRLLALACLQHATELDATIRSEIEAGAAALIPPRSVAEAVALSQVGLVALDLLPRPSELKEDERVATVHTAQMVAGDAGLAYLAAFAGPQSEAVHEALANNWERFDAEQYVTEVLASVPGPAYVTLVDARQLAAIRSLDVNGISYLGDLTGAQLARLPQAPALREISLIANDAITDLRWVTAFPALKSLTLISCMRLRSLDGLQHTEISHLVLDNLDGKLDVGALEHLPTLHHLELATELPDRGISELPACNGLAGLWLDSIFFESADLNGLARWRKLTTLALPSEPFVEEFVEVRGLPRLTTLCVWDLNLTAGTPLAEVPPLPGITSARLTTTSRNCDLTQVARLFPGARTISLTSFTSGASVDLTPLSALPHLQRLALTDFTTITGTTHFGPDVVQISPRPRH
ncbi:NACHT domain-containing protein [Streptomyces sp. HSW2009]|uniref:NACHT domain-containing protein n=1 Tax=Streptomyces sp. HSW2009 TaxID=3142890 RepID=UPI0032EB96C6